MALNEKQLESILKSAETIVSVVKDTLGTSNYKNELFEWANKQIDWITIGVFRDKFALGDKSKKIVKDWYNEGLVKVDEETIGKSGFILSTKFKSESHIVSESKHKISFFDFIKSLQRSYMELAFFGTQIRITDLWKTFRVHTELPKEIFESFLTDCFYLFPTQIRLDPSDSIADTGIKIKNVSYAYVIMFKLIYG